MIERVQRSAKNSQIQTFESKLYLFNPRFVIAFQVDWIFDHS